MALWSVLNSRTRSVIESSSKTVMGHWPIESSNLSLSATPSRPESARAVGGGLEVLYRRLFHWSGWSQDVPRKRALLPARDCVRPGRHRHSCRCDEGAG